MQRAGQLRYDSLSLNGDGYFSFLFVSDNADTLFLHQSIFYVADHERGVRKRIPFLNESKVPPKPMLRMLVLWSAFTQKNSFYNYMPGHADSRDQFSVSIDDSVHYVERFAKGGMVDSMEAIVYYSGAKNTGYIKGYKEMIYASRFNDFIQTRQWSFSEFEPCVPAIDFDALYQRIAAIEISDSAVGSSVTGPPAVPVKELTGLEWEQLKSKLAIKGVDNRYVLLDFWYLSCIGCLMLEEDFKAFPVDSTIQVVGINARDSEEKINSFVSKHKIGHVMLRDEDAFLSALFKPVAYPTLVLLDMQQERILQTYKGFHKNFAAELREIIRE